MELPKMDFPFAPESVTEVPLGSSPLVSVLFQVRLPMPLSKIQNALTSGRLQDELSEDYPYAQQQDSFQLVIQPGRPPVQEPNATAWVLTSADQAHIATVTSDAISLTSRSYTSRRDFCRQVERLLQAVEKVAAPPQAARVGVRYINRVQETDDLGEWIQSLAAAARGISVAMKPGDRRNLQLALTQMQYRFPGSSNNLLVRLGLLPADAVLDASMPSVPQPSWVLDIDAFNDASRPFDASGIITDVEDLAARAYRFFRWVITPASLDRFEPKEVS